LTPAHQSTQAFERWSEIFQDPVMTAAMIDRLTHQSYAVNMNGNSFRMEETKEWLQSQNLAVGIAFFISGEAYRRIMNPVPVEGMVLYITATIGVVVNLYIGLGMRDQADNVNIRSAMLHVLSDAAASAGVIAAGVIMYFTKWYILDLILSILIAVLVAFGAWRVIKETYVVLMEGTPVGIQFEEVEKAIRSVSGVKDIHDLHIWSLTSNRNAMSGHIRVDGDLSVKEAQMIIRKIERVLLQKFQIGHATIQVEDNDHPHDKEMFGIDRNWVH
jgi:cobalt-zinc-cadmium efflux system protein